jgi:hypothetical protein
VKIEETPYYWGSEPSCWLDIIINEDIDLKTLPHKKVKNELYFPDKYAENLSSSPHALMQSTLIPFLLSSVRI